MKRRTSALQSLEVAAFVEVDDGALKAKDRKVFRARKDALVRYAQGETIVQIERATGVSRSQLYALLKRCGAPHCDGRAFGFRALVPYTHIAEYDRLVPVATARGGAAGAFACLLQSHPPLRAWLDEHVKPQHAA